jgi:hypothetical protein
MNNREEDFFGRIIGDNINLNNNGFYLRTQGRDGYLYFVEDSTVVPIDIEMPAVKHLDILIYGEPRFICKRYNFKNRRVEKLTIEQGLRIHKLLVDWLTEQQIRHDIQST